MAKSALVPITLPSDPTSAMHAATKQYVDGKAGGNPNEPVVLAPVRIVSPQNANLTLSGLAAIDGVTPIVGDRVLAVYQSTATQNGIWVAASGAWTRATDADTAAKVARGTRVWSGIEGSTQKNKEWTQLKVVTTFASDAQEWKPQVNIDTGGVFTYPTPVGGGHLFYDGNAQALMLYDSFLSSWVPASGVVVCTSTTRPQYPVNGTVMYETDTTRSYVRVAGNWVSLSNPTSANPSAAISSAPVGSIQMFGGAASATPVGWLACDGTVYNISDYPALGALLLSTYGGNGTTTFAVPDLRSRVPVGAGQGGGLTNRARGTNGGAETVALSVAQMPAHNHAWQGVNDSAAAPGQAGNYPFRIYQDRQIQWDGTRAAVLAEGGGAAHENMPPFGVVTYIIKATPAATSGDEALHVNSHMDLVTSSTVGAGGGAAVTARNVPSNYDFGYAAPDATGVFLVSDAGVTSSGSGYSAKLTVPVSHNFYLLSSQFAAPAGSVVTVSGWFRSNGPAIYLGIMSGPTNPAWFDGVSTTQSNNYRVPTDLGWYRFSASFTIPAGHINARLLFRAASYSGDNGAAGDLWVDATETRITYATSAVGAASVNVSMTGPWGSANPPGAGVGTSFTTPAGVLRFTAIATAYSTVAANAIWVEVFVDSVSMGIMKLSNAVSTNVHQTLPAITNSVTVTAGTHYLYYRLVGGASDASDFGSFFGVVTPSTGTLADPVTVLNGYKTANQAVSANAWTTLTGWTITNAYPTWAAESPPGNFTVPADGYYRIDHNALNDNATNAIRASNIMVNDVIVAQMNGAGNANTHGSSSIWWEGNLRAGDRVAFQHYCGAASNVDGATVSAAVTRFNIRKIINGGIPASGGSPDTAWTAPSMVNGWVDYGAPWEGAAYRRVGGVTYLRGLIRSGTATSQTVIFTLPAGFRSNTDQHVVVASNGSWGVLNIYADGRVTCNTNSSGWTSLRNITFPADQ